MYKYRSQVAVILDTNCLMYGHLHHLASFFSDSIEHIDYFKFEYQYDQTP